MTNLEEVTATPRRIESYGPESIRIHGITRGPNTGWTWDSPALSHPTGIRMIMTPDAAQRITTAVAAYRPATKECLTGFQIQALPDAERAEWQAGCDHATRSDNDHNGYTYGGRTTDDGVHVYTRVTRAVAGVCEFDTSEVAHIVRGR